jgi:hypothetical protein
MSKTSPPKIRRRGPPPRPADGGGNDPGKPPAIVMPAEEQPKKPRNRGWFPENVSGNPRGRPRGARGVKTIFRKVLGERISVRTPKGKRKIDYFEVLLLKERQLAMDGDWRARRTLLELGMKMLPNDEEGNPDVAIDQPFTETDQQILEWFESELRARIASEKGDPANDIQH